MDYLNYPKIIMVDYLDMLIESYINQKFIEPQVLYIVWYNR